MLGLRGGSLSQPRSSSASEMATSTASVHAHDNGYDQSSTLTKVASNGNSSRVSTNHTHTYNERTTARNESQTIIRSNHTHTFSSDQQIEVLRQTVISTRSMLIGDLSHVDSHFIDSTTVESFLEFIESERLCYMPQRGSRWDKVLKWAEFFALQISGYANAVNSFVPDSSAAAKLIWASCRVLIELGQENAQAVELAFAMFYKAALSLSFFLHHKELLSANSHIRSEAGRAFDDLLMLTRDVSLHYYTHVNTLSSSFVTLDFNHLFGRTIDSFYSRKDHIIEAMWSCKTQDDLVDIRAVRAWLSIHDNTMKSLLRLREVSRSHRHEFTCDWFQAILLDFSRGDEKILAVTGPSGSGKSVLSAWVAERLQQPLGKKTFTTLNVSIDPDLPRQCTALAVAKNIALQLLGTNIGDVRLLKALSQAHTMSQGGSDGNSVEDRLWEAIENGVHSFKAEHLLIIVDGLDDRCGHQTASSVSLRIEKLVSKHSHVRAIIFAQNASHLKKTKAKISEFQVTADHTHDDLGLATEELLGGCQHFLNLKGQEQELLIEKLVHAAKGNFLWIRYMINFLKLEKSCDDFMKAVKSATGSPKPLEQLIRDMITLATSDYTKPDTIQLLSWIFVSERPLAVTEIKNLFRIDMQKKSLSVDDRDIVTDVIKICSSLVTVQYGIVCFQHGAIREQIAKISMEGKQLRNLQVLQTDFVSRLLTYTKIRLTRPCEAIFELPKTLDVGNLLLSDPLLEYAARTWIFHFKLSSLYNAKTPLALPAEFKALFPGSVQLAMIEWYCWKSQASGLEARGLHTISLEVRQAVFSENHESVFQTLITCGHAGQQISRMDEARSYFYRASKVGQSIFKSYSPVTVSCTTTFLEIIHTVKSTTRTEIIMQKEELILYMISAYSKQFGRTSDLVIRYSKTLAELYVEIHEEHKAELVWKELREIIVSRYGKGSAEENSICGHLKVVLKKGKKQDEVTEYERHIFGTVSEMEVWDARRIQIILELAVSCEARGELLKTEEYYVMLWRGLINHCRESHHGHVDIEIRISMLDISLEYVRFLRRHHRHEEAAGVLICIWAEYEEYDFESEVIFCRLKLVGELMRSVSLLSIAVSVFKKCWSWFKSHEKHEHMSSCQILISETIEEIVTTTKTTTTTVSSTTITSTEVVVREIFESSISKSSVTVETISICRSLISLYMNSQQWSEAIIVTKRSLELIWRMAISTGGTVTLPHDFKSEAIELAISLAICHHRLHHFHEAETMYRRIYRACFNSCQLDDDRFTKSYTTLITFYEEHHHWHKVIALYQEVLAASRKHLGATHALTIRMLYTVASLCEAHGHGHAHEFYEEIIMVLNTDSNGCHHESLDAMKAMCRIYYEEGQWQKLKQTCEILWKTWIHHHHTHVIDAHFIELLYIRYIYVLEHHSHAGYEVIRTITLQYRDTCVLVYGASVEISIKALIELAHICMRSERYIHEAVNYYEEVIKTTTTVTKNTSTATVVSSTTITTVRKRLTEAYIHVCSQSTVTSNVIERAILVMTERFEHMKITLGCSHTETLSILCELVLMYWKKVTKENRVIVIRLLLETTIAIISKEKNSRTLHAAAKTMAGMYRRCDLRDEGRIMLREIHRQIISRSYTSRDPGGFKVDKSIGKGSYVFLVTFEEVLEGSSCSNYPTVMADLLIESILYESYGHCIKSETDIEIVLATSAKLFVFLEKSSRKEQLEILREDVHKIFIKKWGSVFKIRTEITVAFLTSLLRVLGTTTQHIHIGDAACISSNNIIRKLLSEGEYNNAYEIAVYAFHFLEHQGSYHQLQNVGYGFKLSALMALRGVKPVGKMIEPEMRTKMLELSSKIICEVLKACKDSKINFVRLKLCELNDLVGLLGEQENWTDLEWLLKSLWSSREVQKNWTADTIVAIGTRFVQAHFLSIRKGTNGNAAKAISLCEAITYNLRRVYGSLDPKSLALSELLSQIYVEAKHYREAMRVHEDILHLVVDGGDDDDRTPDMIDAKTARKHVGLLRQCFLRNQGWHKDAKVYKNLIDKLLTMPEYHDAKEFEGLQSSDKWNVKDKPDSTGLFVPPLEWELVDPRKLIEIEESGKTRGTTKSTHRVELRRITSNWGMNIHLLTPEADYEEYPLPREKFQPDILVRPAFSLEPKKKVLDEWRDVRPSFGTVI